MIPDNNTNLSFQRISNHRKSPHADLKQETHRTHPVLMMRKASLPRSAGSPPSARKGSKGVRLGLKPSSPPPLPRADYLSLYLSLSASRALFVGSEHRPVWRSGEEHQIMNFPIHIYLSLSLYIYIHTYMYNTSVYIYIYIYI